MVIRLSVGTAHWWLLMVVWPAHQIHLGGTGTTGSIGEGAMQRVRARNGPARYSRCVMMWVEDW